MLSSNGVIIIQGGSKLMIIIRLKIEDIFILLLITYPNLSVVHLEKKIFSKKWTAFYDETYV